MDDDKIKKSTTTDGSLPWPGLEEAGAPAPIDKKTGQHEAYWVLKPEERAKGFVRPVRRSYVHERCGGVTTMSIAIAETYACDPKYYGATMCVHCCGHFPVGEQGEFLWAGTNEKVGT